MDYADLFIYDEAQQEAALSDLAILEAPRKCLVLRLGDSKQTSGGTSSSDLARRVRQATGAWHSGSSQDVFLRRFLRSSPVPGLCPGEHS